MNLKRYQATEDQIRNAIHMQVMARRNPKRITYPDKWVPRTQLDKFVAHNLMIDMGAEDIIKLFPHFSVSLVKGALG